MSLCNVHANLMGSKGEYKTINRRFRTTGASSARNDGKQRHPRCIGPCGAVTEELFRTKDDDSKRGLIAKNFSHDQFDNHYPA